MIIIFSIKNDFSTQEVIKWLNYLNQEVIVINSDEDIYKLKHIDKDGIHFYNILTKRTYNLLTAKSCWWRRTGISLKNFSYTEPRKNFAVDGIDLSGILYGPKNLISAESEELKDYIFNKVYANCSINIGRPKLFGLNRLLTIDLAQAKGFKVPSYEVITNLNQIPEADTITDKFVTKAIYNGIYHQVDNKMFYSYTELNDKSEYANQDVKVFPSLITSLIKKKFEIRSFYLDGHFFSMSIFSQSSDQTKVDFRKYNGLKPNKTEPFKLPKEVEVKLKAIFDEVGLNSGSADLIVDENDEYVFLEINPVGQYGMTSGPCNYNLDKIIAKYLIDGRISI